jgi:hypothetical protein
MAKKLNIKGVSVDYGNVPTWNGCLWSPQELQDYYEKSERDYQEALQVERDVEQAKKDARKREVDAYQASLNVSNNNYAPIPLSDSEIKDEALGMTAVIFGGFLFTCILALLVLPK